MFLKFTRETKPRFKAFLFTTETTLQPTQRNIKPHGRIIGRKKIKAYSTPQPTPPKCKPPPKPQKMVLSTHEPPHPATVHAWTSERRNAIEKKNQKEKEFNKRITPLLGINIYILIYYFLFTCLGAYQGAYQGALVQNPYFMRVCGRLFDKFLSNFWQFFDKFLSNFWQIFVKILSKQFSLNVLKIWQMTPPRFPNPWWRIHGHELQANRPRHRRHRSQLENPPPFTARIAEKRNGDQSDQEPTARTTNFYIKIAIK